MAFAYYKKLSPAQQRIYRQSDEVAAIPLPGAELLAPRISAIGAALEGDRRGEVEQLCQELASRLTDRLQVGRVRVKVLAVRPSSSSSELHGLYTRTEGETPEVSVWMRTARRKQVVAFRTFLRTFLHEICHHLDYEKLRLADSFHTEGFYKRESSLMKQLAGPGRRKH